jgi:hypothetical protein
MILIKLYFTASAPNSELGKIINKDELRLDNYLDRIVQHFSQAAAGDRTRPSGKFTMILIMLKMFFLKRRKELEGRSEDQKMEDDTEESSATPDTARTSQMGAPQTPLQMLSTAAVSGITPGASVPKTPKTPGSYYTTSSSAAMNPGMMAPTPAPYDLQYYPQTPWSGNMNLGNIVEFQSGDFNLGLGGVGSEAFMDDTFWGLMDQTGMGMSWAGSGDDMGFS